MSIQAVAWALEHSNAKGSARLVLIGLANHTDEQGRAWPSIATLARYANVSERWVTSCLNELVELGEITRESIGHGRVSSRYRMEMDQSRGEPQFTPEPEITPEPQFRAEVNHSSVQPRTTVHPNLNRTIIEPSEEKIPKRKTDFDAFWKLYPKKVAKGAARRAYVSAIRKVDHETIIDGLERYRPAKGFICNPATWLNQERWSDEGNEEAGVAEGHRSGKYTEALDRFVARREVR